MKYSDFHNITIAGLYRKDYAFPENPGIGDLTRLMQQATEHAMERLGVSVEDLKSWNLSWVICLSQIEILRMPRKDEMVELYTWPGKEKMGMYTRRYAAYNQEGEELFHTASMFSLMNRETRTMVLPNDAGFIFPVLKMPEEPALPRFTQKTPELSREFCHVAAHGEIDGNGHVNNARYLDWAAQILPGIAENTRHIWINYAKEVLENASVVMKYTEADGNLYVKGYVQEENCFTIILES